MVPDSIEDHRHLALTIYRMAHGCSFKVLKDLFGVSQPVAMETFNQIIRVMVSCLYRVSKKNCLLKMLTKENLTAIDCKHVFRAVNIKFNDQLMTRVKGIKKKRLRSFSKIF